MCLVLGLAACGNKPSKEELEEAKQQSEIVKEEREQTLERVEEEEEKEEVNPTDVLGGPIEYKMVELGTAEVSGRHLYAFVVQVGPAKNDTVYHSLEFKKGDVLVGQLEGDDIDYVCYESDIITDEYKKELLKDFEEQLEKSKAEDADPDMLKYGYEYPWAIGKDDCVQSYVYVINSGSPININDYSLTVKRGTLYGSETDETVLSFKGELSEINMAPYYISGAGLVQLNGRYMVLNSGSSGSGGGSAGDTISDYGIYHFYDIFSPFDEEKDMSFYTEVPVEWYFGSEKGELKDSWKVHFEIERDNKDIAYSIGVAGPRAEEDDIATFVNKYTPAIMTDNGPVILK